MVSALIRSAGKRRVSRAQRSTSAHAQHARRPTSQRGSGSCFRLCHLYAVVSGTLSASAISGSPMGVMGSFRSVRVFDLITVTTLRAAQGATGKLPELRRPPRGDPRRPSEHSERVSPGRRCPAVIVRLSDLDRLGATLGSPRFESEGLGNEHSRPWGAANSEGHPSPNRSPKCSPPRFSTVSAP